MYKIPLWGTGRAVWRRASLLHHKQCSKTLEPILLWITQTSGVMRQFGIVRLLTTYINL